MVLGGASQRVPHPVAAMLCIYRQAIDGAPPAVPAGDDAADDAALHFGDDQRVGIAAEQTGERVLAESVEVGSAAVSQKANTAGMSSAVADRSSASTALCYEPDRRAFTRDDEL